MNEKIRARVSTIYGAYYGVRPEQTPEVELLAQLRGRLRKKETRSSEARLRNPAIIGDWVICSRDERDDTRAHIENIEPRGNMLCRAAGHTGHGLGANLDRAVVVAGLALPETPTRFVDRFLVSCRAGGVAPIIVWSKVDLTGASETVTEIVELYRGLGYQVFALDLLTGQPEGPFAALLELLSSGTSLLAGNSGTGKSTLLNKILGSNLQRTAEVSHASLKGRHTTTNPRMLLPAQGDARYIDTPGVKEWGVLHLTRREIFEGFPEFAAVSGDCRFPNCSHEPGDSTCAVQAKIQEASQASTGGPHPDRIASLHAMLESLDHPDRIRYGDYVKPTGRMRQQ